MERDRSIYRSSIMSPTVKTEFVDKSVNYISKINNSIKARAFTFDIIEKHTKVLLMPHFNFDSIFDFQSRFSDIGAS